MEALKGKPLTYEEIQENLDIVKQIESKNKPELLKHDRRKDLMKYYKHILICKHCNKYFGMDNIKDSNRLCPVCKHKKKPKTNDSDGSNKELGIGGDDE